MIVKESQDLNISYDCSPKAKIESKINWIAKNLGYIRKLSNISRQDLATLIGVTRQTIRNIEDNEKITFSKCVTILKSLEISMKGCLGQEKVLSFIYDNLEVKNIDDWIKKCLLVNVHGYY